MTNDVERVLPISNDEDVEETRRRPSVVLMATISAVAIVVSVATYVAIPPAFGGRDEPVSISCMLNPPNLHKGQRAALTYIVNADREMTVGLRAQLYDRRGRMHASGTASVDRVGVEETFSPAANRKRWSKEVQRPFVVPEALDYGLFQIVAEAWPAGRLGAEHTTTLTSALCGYLTFPD